jgi:hypothetical protein
MHRSTSSCCIACLRTKGVRLGFSLYVILSEVGVEYLRASSCGLTRTRKVRTRASLCGLFPGDQAPYLTGCAADSRAGVGRRVLIQHCTALCHRNTAIRNVEPLRVDRRAVTFENIAVVLVAEGPSRQEAVAGALPVGLAYVSGLQSDGVAGEQSCHREQKLHCG